MRHLRAVVLLIVALLILLVSIPDRVISQVPFVPHTPFMQDFARSTDAAAARSKLGVTTGESNAASFDGTQFVVTSNNVTIKSGAVVTNLVVSNATASRGAIIGPDGMLTNSLATDQQVNYLQNVTNDIQTELDIRTRTNNGVLHAPTLHGNIKLNNETANRVAVIDGNGTLRSSTNVDTNELNFINGLTENVQAALDLLGEGGVPTLTNLTDFPSWNGITNHETFVVRSNGIWQRMTNDFITNAVNLVASTVHTQWKAFRWDVFGDPAPNLDELGQVAWNSTLSNTLPSFENIGGVIVLTNRPYGQVIGQVEKITDLYDFPTVFGTNRVVNVLGYAVAGDGGGGFFQLQPTNAATVTNIGTHINSSNTARVWVRMRDGPNVFKPRWFGAKGDDNTDDQPAFQAMFNAISKNFPLYDPNLETNWATIHITQGYYVLGSTVYITNATDHLHIRHDGYSSKVRTGINSQNFPLYSMDFGSISSKVLIEGGQYASHGWQGSASNSFINVVSGNLLDVTVADCWFQGFETIFRGQFITALFEGNNFDQTGETIMDTHDPINLENLRSIQFVNNVFFEPGDDALIFRSEGTPRAQIDNGKAAGRIRIVGNEFNRVPNDTQVNHWIIFDGAIDAVVSGNTFNGRTPDTDTTVLHYQNGSAVRALGMKYLTIGNNQISDMIQPGLFISNCFNVSITGNVIDNVRTNDVASTGGVFIMDTTDLVMTGNSLVQSGGHGIYMDSVTNFVVDNNVVKNAKRAGYYIVRSNNGKLGGMAVDNNVGNNVTITEATGATLITTTNVVVDGLVSYVSNPSLYHDNNLRIASDSGKITISDCILEPVKSGGSALVDSARDTMIDHVRGIPRITQVFAHDMAAWQGSPVYSTSSAGRHIGWRLDPATDEAVQFYVDEQDVLEWGNGNVTVKVYVSNAYTGAAANVSMEYVYEARAEGENINNAGVFVSQSFPISATQFEFQTLTFTTTVAWVPGDIMHSFRIRRDGDGSAGTDDFTNDILLMGVELVHE